MKGEGTMDTVARMILLAERDTSTTLELNAEMSSKQPKKKQKKRF